MQCERISWQKFDTLCHRLTDKIIAADFVPQMIIAIGRGGYMPARILADHLGIMNLTSFKIEHYLGPKKSRQATVVYPLSARPEGQRVLLVDDVSDSGDTFEVAVKHVLAAGQPQELRTAVLHHKTRSTFTPDFYATKVIKWRWITYPWAVTEDLAMLIPQLRQPQRTLEDIQRGLAEGHGMHVSQRQIKDARRLLDLGNEKNQPTVNTT